MAVTLVVLHLAGLTHGRVVVQQKADRDGLQ
jgi:hypothetical protein